MPIQQHTIQCVFDVDELENDDVIDETQRLDVDETDETHRTDVQACQQLVPIDITDEIEQNEKVAQEIDDNVEVVVDDDDTTLETDEIDDIEAVEVRQIIIQWTDEIDEIDEMVESGEDDETDDTMEADMLLDVREIDETDIFDETDEVHLDDAIVCRIDTLELDETESFNDENDEKATKQCQRDDDNDEMQSIICIDSDCMLVKYSTIWFVRNDDNDELDDVIVCQVHTQLDDEIDDVEQIDEKYSFDILEILHNDVLMWADEVDELDEMLLEAETVDVREQIEVIDVIWFAKLCNLFQ